MFNHLNKLRLSSLSDIFIIFKVVDVNMIKDLCFSGTLKTV